MKINIVLVFIYLQWSNNAIYWQDT